MVNTQRYDAKQKLLGPQKYIFLTITLKIIVESFHKLNPKQDTDIALHVTSYKPKRREESTRLLLNFLLAYA